MIILKSILVYRTPSSSGGTSIQFQDEGVNLGNNQADTVDFTGAGVTATRALDKVTVNIPGPTLAELGTTLQTAANDTPLDADTFNFWDAVDAILKKVSWANIKTSLNSLYWKVSGTTATTGDVVVNTATGPASLSIQNSTNQSGITIIEDAVGESAVGLFGGSTGGSAGEIAIQLDVTDILGGGTGLRVVDQRGTPRGLQTAASGYVTDARSYVDREYLESVLVGLWDDRGNFSAAGGAYPATGGSGTAGAILKGDIWTISVAGTLPTAQVVEVGDTVRALVDTPGNTQANWAIQQNNIGYTAENTANKVSSISASVTQYPNNNAVIAYAQPLDTDLTTIAGLTATTNNFMLAFGGAWASRTPAEARQVLMTPAFYKNTTAFSTTSTSEVVADAACLIPANTLQAGDTIYIWSIFTKSGTNNAVTIRFKTNTTADLTGSPVLLGLSIPANTTLFAPFERHIGVVSTSSQFVISSGSASATDDVNSTNAFTALTLDLTVNQYILPTLQGGGAGTDTNTLRGWFVQIIRQ